MPTSQPGCDQDRAKPYGAVHRAGRIRPKYEQPDRSHHDRGEGCRRDQHRVKTTLAFTLPTPCALTRVEPWSITRTRLLRLSGHSGSLKSQFTVGGMTPWRSDNAAAPI